MCIYYIHIHTGPQSQYRSAFYVGDKALGDQKKNYKITKQNQILVTEQNLREITKQNRNRKTKSQYKGSSKVSVLTIFFISVYYTVTIQSTQFFFVYTKINENYSALIAFYCYQ